MNNWGGKKKTRKQLVKQLDKVFSEYIRLRDNYCVTCGSRENLTCGHVLSRSAYATRWNPKNAFCQCWGCNYRHEFDPWPLIKHFINSYSGADLEELHRLYNTPTKYKNYQLEEMYEHYSMVIKHKKEIEKNLDIRENG